MASSGSDISSDEIYNFKCSPCLDDNRHREAEKYCVECQGYFCQPCAEMFHKLPGLKGHKFLDQTNYKSSGVLGRLPAIPTQICSVHGTKIVDMYCGNHDEVACTSCMTLNHRSCFDVKSIPDIVDNAPKMPDIKRMNQKLNDLKMLKEKVVDTKRAQREDLKKSKLDAITEIRKYRKDLDAFLDNIDKGSISEVLEVFQKVDQEICHDKTETENEIDLLERSLNDLKQSEGNNAQLFVSLKMAASNIVKMDNATMPQQTSSETRITYNFNTIILTTLQNLKTFGSALQPRTTTSLVWSVESIKDFDISLQSDAGTCDTYGTCLTTDGFLLLSDYTNKKLKRADIQNMSVKDYCSLPGAPYGVCCTRDTEAAVCLDNNSVQFVSLNRQLTLTRNMKLNHSCFGIAYKDQKLYITDNYTSIYIYALTGPLLIKNQDSSGKNIFQYPRNIAFSDIDDKMLVASWTKGLVFLDGKGNYCQTLTEPELKTVSNVCTDNKGVLFVSGFRSHNVIQIGSGGTKMGAIIKSSDGLQRPESMCFEKRKRMLFISQRHSNIVKVAFLKQRFQEI